MYSDAVSEISEATVLSVRTNGRQTCVFDTWKDWHPSNISHHSKLCCEIARQWITSTDFSCRAGGDVLAGPRWLRNTFKWGGTTYPIYWCDAVRKHNLDCGTLAALAHEVFTMRGVKSFRAQFVQRFSRLATESWRHSWKSSGASMQWVNGALIYHEGCGVEIRTGEIKVWDASAGWWIDPRPGDGYGALLALRLSAPSGTPDLTWGDHAIRPNTWQNIA
ncbi:MAG: hypothetical protein ABI791_14385 [Acidobacteriota bacterium]